MSSNNRYFGGMLLLIRKSIRKGVKVIDNLDGDKILIKLEKSFFNFKNDVYIIFTYASPALSPYVKHLDYDLFRKIEEDISLYSAKGNVIVAGDFNAKTNTMNDFVLDDGDDHTPVNDIDMYMHDSYMSRQNVDTHAVDAQGKKLLELCKNSRVRILNGRTNGDRFGKFTRFPAAIRESPSTIDYVLADCEIRQQIKSLTVLPSYGLSDHECLCLAINTKFSSAEEGEDHTPVNKTSLFKYAKENIFSLRLNTVEGKNKLNDFLITHNGVSDKETINSMCQDFTDLISFFSKSAKLHPTKRHRKQKRHANDSPWYSSTCRAVKQSLNIANRLLRKNPFDKSAQTKYINARKKFKSICKTTEQEFRKKLTSKLLRAENKNPKEFWDVIQKMRKWGNVVKGDNPIDPSEWQIHFQSLLNQKSDLTSETCAEIKRMENSPSFSDLDFRITSQDIMKAFKRLNKKATPGPDKISGKLIYAGVRELMPLILLVFNKRFSHAHMP